MARNILHVVESSAPEAGTVAVLLDGLHAALRERSIESDMIALNGSTTANSTGLIGDVDLLHFHGWGHSAARPLAVAARRAGKPYVISPLGSLTYGPNRRRTLSDRLAGPFGEGRAVSRAVSRSTSTC